MSTTTVRVERDGSVARILIDYPPINVLAQPVRAGLHDAFYALGQDTSVAAIVLAGSGRVFAGGVDLHEFGKPLATPYLNTIIELIEQSRKPVIAAIQGYALGGGLELALGCHYRCALPEAQLGFPEVHFGLLPGVGGTQRLPRLLGIPTALDLIVSGTPVTATTAQRLGLVDHLLAGDLPTAATAYAHRLLTERAPLRRLRDLTLHSASVPTDFFANYRQQIRARCRCPQIEERCIDAIAAATSLTYEQGLKHERALLLEALAAPESKALRYLFFAERQARTSDTADLAKRLQQVWQRDIAALRQDGVTAAQIGQALHDFGISAATVVDLLAADPTTSPATADNRQDNTQDLVNRCLYPLIDTAAHWLDEGSVPRAGDIDVALTAHSGFPRWRGGLLYYADQLGAEAVYEALQRLAARYGDRFRPGLALRQRAAEGRQFRAEAL